MVFYRSKRGPSFETRILSGLGPLPSRVLWQAIPGRDHFQPHLCDVVGLRMGHCFDCYGYLPYDSGHHRLIHIPAQACITQSSAFAYRPQTDSTSLQRARHLRRLRLRLLVRLEWIALSQVWDLRIQHASLRPFRLLPATDDAVSEQRTHSRRYGPNPHADRYGRLCLFGAWHQVVPARNHL